MKDEGTAGFDFGKYDYFFSESRYEAERRREEEAAASWTRGLDGLRVDPPGVCGFYIIVPEWCVRRLRRHPSAKPRWSGVVIKSVVAKRCLNHSDGFICAGKRYAEDGSGDWIDLPERICRAESAAEAKARYISEMRAAIAERKGGL